MPALPSVVSLPRQTYRTPVVEFAEVDPPEPREAWVDRVSRPLDVVIRDRRLVAVLAVEEEVG